MTDWNMLMLFMGCNLDLVGLTCYWTRR